MQIFENQNRKQPTSRMIRTKILLLYYLLHSLTQIECIIQSITHLTPFSAPILAYDVAGTHMVILTNTTPSHIEMYDFATGYLTVIPNLSYTNPISIATNPFNSNTSFCLAVQTNISFIQRESLTSQCDYSTFIDPNYPYYSMGFGDSKSQLFATHYSNNATISIWHRGSGQLVNLTNSRFNQFICTQQIFNNISEFFACQDLADPSNKKLTVYIVNLTNYPFYKTQFPYPNCSNMTLDAYQSHMIVNCQTWIDIRNFYDPYDIISTITLGSRSTGCAIVGDTIMVTMLNGSLLQYGLTDATLLDQGTLPAGGPFQVKRVGTGQFFVFNAYDGQGLLGAQPFLPPGNITINGTTNGTINFTTNSTTLNNTTVNGTANFTINSTMNNTLSNTNSTTNQTINTTSTIPQPNTTLTVTQEEDKNSIFTASFNETVRNGSYNLGMVLSIMSSKLTMPSNVPLSIFMEEFWLYRYYVGLNYSDYMSFFIQEVQIVNFLKFQPTFLSFLKPKFSIGSSAYYREIYTTSALSYSPIYYVESVKQSFTVNLIATCLIYLFIRFCFCFYPKPRRQSCCIRKLLYQWLRERGYWWSLLIGLLEADFLALCFYSLNQFALPYSYVFGNKANLVASIVGFLILIFYGTVAYSLLYSTYRRRTSNLLVFSKKNSLPSYCLETAAILSVKLTKSFAHSAILSAPFLKFLFLCMSDCLLIIYLLVFRKSFFNGAHFLLYLLYQLNVATINMIMLLKAMGLGSLIQGFENNTMGVLLMMLLGITFVKMILSYYKIVMEQLVSRIRKSISSIQNSDAKGVSKPILMAKVQCLQDISLDKQNNKLNTPSIPNIKFEKSFAIKIQPQSLKLKKTSFKTIQLIANAKKNIKQNEEKPAPR